MKPIILMFCNKKVNSVPYVEYRFSEGQSHKILTRYLYSFLGKVQ